MAGKPATWAKGQRPVGQLDLGSETVEKVAIVDGSGNQITSFGGGTGAATIADGADVAQGTTTDLSSASTVVGLLKAVKAAVAPPAAIVAFVTTVTTAGTRVQLGSNAITAGVIQAPSTNTGKIYVGGITVSSSVFGAELQPGQSVGVALSNSNLVYIDSSVNGEKASFLGS